MPARTRRTCCSAWRTRLLPWRSWRPRSDWASRWTPTSIWPSLSRRRRRRTSCWRKVGDCEAKCFDDLSSYRKETEGDCEVKCFDDLRSYRKETEGDCEAKCFSDLSSYWKETEGDCETKCFNDLSSYRKESEGDCEVKRFDDLSLYCGETEGDCEASVSVILSHTVKNLRVTVKRSVSVLLFLLCRGVRWLRCRVWQDAWSDAEDTASAGKGGVCRGPETCGGVPSAAGACQISGTAWLPWDKMSGTVETRFRLRELCVFWSHKGCCALQVVQVAEKLPHH